ESAACMVTLRDSLHFADALVQGITYSAGAGAAVRNYLVVKVIEPQDANRVRWAPAPPDSLTVLRPAYGAVVLPTTDSLGQLWLALTEALRDPNGAVRTAASIVLQEMPARPVDWAPAVPTLRLLLGGTNLLAIEGVFTMLTRTTVSPSLAGPLLGSDGTWVLE